MKEGLSSMLSGLAQAMGGPQTAGLKFPGLPGGEGGMTEAVMGFPSVARMPGVIDESGAIGNEDPITITGDGWKPHKPTILGAIADGYLMSQGLKPAFSTQRAVVDAQSAMQGFTKDPMRAIKRLGQIPGMQDKAWELYNQTTDNERLRGNLDRQNNIFDMKKEELVYNRIASMMGAANEGTWGRMRDLAQATADKYGVDISGLVPEEYDPASIDYIRQGAIRPKDQVVLEQGERRLDQGEERIQQGDRRINETIRHHGVQEGQAAANEAGRQARHTTPKPAVAKPRPRTVRTNRGEIGLVDKDNTRMLVARGGKHYLYLYAGKTKDGKDNWVPQGEVAVKP